MADEETFFLSYSRSDEEFALRFARDLRASGINVWVDQLNIRPSEHWDRAIERAVHACSGLIVVLSPRSVQSENVADEISFALNSGKRVLPVLIEQCAVPLRITRMQMIDATTDYGRAVEQCVAEIGRSDEGASPAPRAEAPPKSATIAQGEVERVAIALTTYLGPIAPIVTRREANVSVSPDELRNRVAMLIPTDADRREFLKRLGDG